MKMHSNSIKIGKNLGNDFSRIRRNSRKAKLKGQTVTPFKSFTNTLR